MLDLSLKMPKHGVYTQWCLRGATEEGGGFPLGNRLSGGAPQACGGRRPRRPTCGGGVVRPRSQINYKSPSITGLVVFSKRISFVQCKEPVCQLIEQQYGL